jgi:hypothetical protein
VLGTLEIDGANSDGLECERQEEDIVLSACPVLRASSVLSHSTLSPQGKCPQSPLCLHAVNKKT